MGQYEVMHIENKDDILKIKAVFNKRQEIKINTLIL